MSGFGLHRRAETFDLLSASPLEAAIVLSLFSDGRVESEDLPDGETSQRGFWGDALTNGKTGSKLWLLARAKETPDVLDAAEGYARDALSWLVEDGHTTNLAVVSSFERGCLVLDVTLDAMKVRYAL